MTPSSNDATHNRPEGSRSLDGPAFPVDLVTFSSQLKNETAWTKQDRNSITVFKTPGLTLVLTALHEGAVLDNLPEDGVMIIQVLEGSLAAETEKGQVELGVGQMLVLHNDAGQHISADKEAVVLLTIMMEDPIF